MRISRLFSQTLREAPTDVDVASHQLLVRAGYIRQLGTGIFSYLPLAHRSMEKIKAIMRSEIDAIGGQEITMPVVQPADLWQETGRWYQIGSEMGRFKDKNDHDMVLAMTHEEVVADLARSEIQSYRQLPALVYQIQTKWRDDPRPRGGLVRVREFTMLDSYSLDATWEGLDQTYREHYQAYFNIYHRCGLDVAAVKSDTGMMGGKLAHEFMYLTPIGEDTLIFCDHCHYSANRQVALFAKNAPPAEAALPLEKVATPHTTTIEDLARLLNLPAARTAKAVFMVAAFSGEAEGTRPGPTERFIFAVVRGDMELNETKLTNLLSGAYGSVQDLRPAQEEEIRAVGAVPGYASPIGLAPRAGAAPALVVVDDLLTLSPNMAAGANEDGYHLLNSNYGRDYTADLIGDIVSAAGGSPCPRCGSPLRASRGVEVGNIFKLGTRYTEALGVNFLDENGQQQTVIMGSYGIGVGRLLACVAEQHHDERGLTWPISLAPYPLHLVALAGKDGRALETAESLYTELADAGLEPLFDDRAESAGIKFNDADLIGLPLRLTVSERSLRQGGVEFKRRTAAEAVIVPLAEAVERARAEIEALYRELQAGVVPVEYD